VPLLGFPIGLEARGFRKLVVGYGDRRSRNCFAAPIPPSSCAGHLGLVGARRVASIGTRSSASLGHDLSGWKLLVGHFAAAGTRLVLLQYERVTALEPISIDNLGGTRYCFLP
jgi:hypothetical protein